jgi:ABC-type phosphate/phosphonate transport system substrate-binding protein
MVLSPATRRRTRRGSIFFGCTLAAILILLAADADAQQPKVDVLRIGTSGTLTTDKGGKEKGALETLRKFIKDETGLENEILGQKDWQELTGKMVKGELHLGVYYGFEFAWAQEQQPDLKPLAVAVNVYRYPVAHVVTKADNPATNFAALQGQSLSIPVESRPYLRLFVEHQTGAAGKTLETFFSKVNTDQNVEDALDDVVDGAVQVAAADRVALEAFKRRKPARFKQLKEVAHSEPFPPPVVAYYGDVLDAATRQRFAKGLLEANRKDAGQTVLTLFRLTGFEPPLDDFGKVLEATRKRYPPPSTPAK